MLVLDDYHVVQAPEVHEAMTFLVDHLPPQLRLVIATRSDPPLPLARLRARGELAEVRAADLRFTEQETAAYFGGMGLRLTSADEVSTLEGRTEGWVAALQLAALSLQGREDAAGFIDGFAGDDRHVVDYLVEEVVHRQPEEVRDFLLRTRVLPRLSGSLADAVTGRTDGRADARDAGPRQPLPGAARRPATLVPLPPPVRRHAARPAARRAARGGGRAAPAGQHLARAGRGHRHRHRARLGRRRRRPGGRLVEARRPGHGPGTPRGAAAALDGSTPRRGLREPSRAGQRATSGR